MLNNFDYTRGDIQVIDFLKIYKPFLKILFVKIL